MKSFLLIILVFWGTSLWAMGDSPESEDSLVNTINHYDISVVDVVVRKLSQYQVGSKRETFSPLQQKTVEQGSLTELISRYQPVYIKTDAGGLASFRFRGTSDSHTSVRVRGLELNSQTLGSYNANNAPVYLFDNVELTFGSSSATQGSGSIGGNVKLGLVNKFNPGVSGDAKVSVGSFGEYMAGARVFAGNGRFESVTRLVYFERENDFPFENTAYYDFESQSYQSDVQQGARIENVNVIQQINYKFNDRQLLSSIVWLAKNRHEAQPNMAENKNVNTRYIEDQNIRTWLQYDHTSGLADYYLGAGYVFDDAIDYSSRYQAISTSRFVSEAGLKKENKWLGIQLGARYLYISPDVYAYDEDISEQRTDVYASFRINPLPWLNASLNLRQQFVTRYDAPFTPALGVEARLWYRGHHIICMSGNLQRAYRIPTLNDRFWGQQGYEGNREIEPEDAVSTELGISYMYADNEHWTFKFKTNVFHMDVKNWLLWTQGSAGWYASNVSRVVSKGLEANLNLKYLLDKNNIEFGSGFTFNPTTRKASKSQTDIPGRQLEYVPEYVANAFIQYSYDRVGMVIDGNYVGPRNYNQAGGSLEAFKLFNISAFYKMKLGDNNLRFDAQLANIFSEQYQNQFQYAMPEISYRLGINYEF